MEILSEIWVMPRILPKNLQTAIIRVSLMFQGRFVDAGSSYQMHCTYFIGNMSDAQKADICSFPDIAHFSDKISRCC